MFLCNYLNIAMFLPIENVKACLKIKTKTEKADSNISNASILIPLNICRMRCLEVL